MTPYYDADGIAILHGDCRELLPELAADVVITDPPYGLAFMGKTWDRVGQGFHQAWATEAFRTLPPGGWLLAFGGTRTYHRLACGIEDAGFEVRDCLMWLYGQGFPKSKMALKPGWEPILLARKPGPTVLNIEACRVGTDTGRGDWYNGKPPRPNGNVNGWRRGTAEPWEPPAGRWPANVALSHTPGCEPTGTRKVRGTNLPSSRETGRNDETGWGFDGRAIQRYADTDGTETVTAWTCEPGCPAAELDRQSGQRVSGWRNGDTAPSVGVVYGNDHRDRTGPHYGDIGGASRFFFTAKAGRDERVKVDGEGHATVKPLALMRWLVRLVTPPGGLILDPFMGSGSTLVAARLEGRRAVGIEADERWCEGATRRLDQGVLDLAGAG